MHLSGHHVIPNWYRLDIRKEKSVQFFLVLLNSKLTHLFTMHPFSTPLKTYLTVF